MYTPNVRLVHALDHTQTKLMQCRILETSGVISRNGACPDTQNDIHSVSGYRESCKTCIKYSRSLKTSRYQYIKYYGADKLEHYYD